MVVSPDFPGDFPKADRNNPSGDMLLGDSVRCAGPEKNAYRDVSVPWIGKERIFEPLTTFMPRSAIC